jgi:hypothetical protein
MLRLLEVALFLAPLGALVVWRVLAGRGGPSLLVVAVAAVALAVLAGTLWWYSRDAALPGGVTYVPARMQPGGGIVPGHGAPE